ncbi:MAG: phosphoethanolamine transferase [Burkholderiales bacterium]
MTATESPRFSFSASVNQVLLAASVLWTLAADTGFFSAALQNRNLSEASTWGWLAGLALLLAAGHFLILSLLVNRWLVKPVLALLIVATAMATYYMQRFGVYLDPSMLRNVMRTDVSEARELFSWSLLPHLLVYAVLPLVVLWRVHIVRQPLLPALAWRLAAALLALLVAAVSLWAIFQPFSSLTRNQKELRYLITPANYLWSLTKVVVDDTRAAAEPRRPIGLDAVPGPSWQASARKPQLLVVVVGETARAANWGLNGYARQTTPQLAQLNVLNFAHVTSCGTNTETSVPCLFAPVGRRDYNEARIRGSESLLHVLARAGVNVFWRDNQAGCKGVCDGLPSDAVQPSNAPGLCEDGHCLDEGLIYGLDERLKASKGVNMLVLHQLGNHGPAYFRRYPSAFARFVPACQQDDLRQCTREEIVNAYDNALLYTDHLLASVIAHLKQHEGDVDSAMIYVSDHGESLGESNLYLHGIPYAIAPAVQTHVPMVMWFSSGMKQQLGLDVSCLEQRARQSAAHDHLFHTVLGLLDVRTAMYEAPWDLTANCRGPVVKTSIDPR